MDGKYAERAFIGESGDMVIDMVEEGRVGFFRHKSQEQKQRRQAICMEVYKRVSIS